MALHFIETLYFKQDHTLQLTSCFGVLPRRAITWTELVLIIASHDKLWGLARRVFTLFSFLWIFLLLWPLSFIFIELYTSEMIPSAAHTHTLVQAGAKKPPLPWLATAHLVLSSFRHPFLSPSASSTINQLLRPRFLFGPSWKTLYRPFPSSALHSSLAQSSELPCLLWKNSDEHYQV